MNVLIIDNGTLHINEFKNILSDHRCTFLSKEALTVNMVADYDALILSGSFSSSVIKHRSRFTHQIELIKDASKPILGICLGFELMIDTCGGSMIRLPDKIQGTYKLTFSPDPLFDGMSDLIVYEGHRWVTKDVPDNFKILAHSESGIEAIRDKNYCLYGVQFHPEVIVGNTNGHTILTNFMKIVANKKH